MKPVLAAAPAEPRGGYMHAAAAFDDERARLRLLEARYDARTFGRLSALGPLAGIHCLEAGAGAGSVARWLAGQAGPAGHVVATDADPRFLAGAAGRRPGRREMGGDRLPQVGRERRGRAAAPFDGANT